MSALSELALFTDDVAAAVAFYRDVVGADPVSEWPGGALFAAGTAKILVHERSAALEGGPPNEDHVALTVADVEAAFAASKESGHVVVVEPRDYPWGRSAYVRDPDGRLVELAAE